MANKLLVSILLYYFVLCHFNFFSESLMAQNTSQNKNKLQKLASEYFNNEEFNKALPLLLTLDTLIPDNFEIKYDIGACYLNTKYEKTSHFKE